MGDWEEEKCVGKEGMGDGGWETVDGGWGTEVKEGRSAHPRYGLRRNQLPMWTPQVLPTHPDREPRVSFSASKMAHLHVAARNASILHSFALS